MNQFVVWGMGKRGKNIVALLGKDYISAIIDNNIEYYNKKYNGVPIISYQEYLKERCNQPIIITPKDYENEISERLIRDGINNFFLYSNNIILLEGFLRQAPRKDLLNNLKNEKKISILGYNILTIVLYDYFCENGYQCSLIECDKIKKRDIFYKLKTLNIQMISIDEIENCVIIVDEKEEKKYNDKLGKCIILERYYNLYARDELYHNEEIEKFKNIHKGKRVFIVGTGPSLKMSDLDILYNNNEICISVNGIFKAFSKTRWRPNYYGISDAVGVLQWQREIEKMDVNAKFISDVAWNFKEKKSNMYKWHMHQEWKLGEKPLFSNDFSKVSYCGTTITYDFALQIAVYMGFSDIYLLGIDCTMASDSSKQHFISEYDSKGNDTGSLNVSQNILAYMSARDYAEQNGINVINATRGGALEVFKRVDFDTLF